MQIAIVGGGIAGLAAAAALGPRHQVTIHEAAPERESVGGALVIWPSARKALAEIGALAAVQRSASPMVRGALHAIEGRALLRAKDLPVLVVRRPDLLAALHAAVPTGVRREHRQIDNPAELDAELVIGADGVRSRVRALINPAAAERRATDYLVMRGELPLQIKPDEAGEYWGRGLLAGMVPLQEGLYWFTTHRSKLGPEPLDVTTALHETRSRFAGAAPVIRRVLDAAGAETLATRLWVAPPMRRYVEGRYVVIGDAAHAMTPNLGRGACDAIVDAVTLARAIERGRIGQWQARRVVLTQLARVGSRTLMRVALSQGTDRILNAIPASSGAASPDPVP